MDISKTNHTIIKVRSQNDIENNTDINRVRYTYSADVAHGLQIITTIMYTTVCIGSIVAVIIIIISFS